MTEHGAKSPAGENVLPVTSDKQFAIAKGYGAMAPLFWVAYVSLT